MIEPSDFTTMSFFFSSRRRHTRFDCDWSSDVCSSDLARGGGGHRTRLMNPPTQAGAATRPKKGNGITMPSRRGGSGRVLTDVIVDLGFVEREAMDEAVEMATSAGSAAERVLLSTGAITED